MNTTATDKSTKKRKIPSWFKENGAPPTPTPSRSKRSSAAAPPTVPPSTPISREPLRPLVTPTNSSTPSTTVTGKKNRPTFRNGYEVTPKPASSNPYDLNRRGRRKEKAFNSNEVSGIMGQQPLEADDWNARAHSAGFLAPGAYLRDFQIDVANWVIERQGDICLIAPTGAGKSLVWGLPLLAQEHGISMVIVPFTSLGHQGELRRCVHLSI